MTDETTIAELRKQVAAYRLLAVNEGWNVQAAEAYGHSDYLKLRIENIDKKAQKTLASGYDAEGYLSDELTLLRQFRDSVADISLTAPKGANGAQWAAQRLRELRRAARIYRDQSDPADALTPKEAELVKPPREVSGDAVGGIPAGMVAWAGGDSAPEDWDGGPVLLRNGARDHEPKYWFHASTGGASFDVLDIIAYTPRLPTASHDAARERIAETLHVEARRLAKAVEGGDDCPDSYDQSALNWIRNRRHHLADAILAALPTTDGEGECAHCGAKGYPLIASEVCDDKVHPYRVRCTVCGCSTAHHGDFRAVWAAWCRRPATPPTTDASERMREAERQPAPSHCSICETFGVDHRGHCDEEGSLSNNEVSK